MGNKRLTVKTDKGYALPLVFEGETTKHLEKIIQAYGEIEDIEQDNEIKLATLVKACKEGIKIKTKNGIEHIKNLVVDFFDGCLQVIEESNIIDDYGHLVWADTFKLTQSLYFCDYGDLWVLENEDFR